AVARRPQTPAAAHRATVQPLTAAAERPGADRRPTRQTVASPRRAGSPAADRPPRTGAEWRAIRRARAGRPGGVQVRGGWGSRSWKLSSRILAAKWAPAEVNACTRENGRPSRSRETRLVPAGHFPSGGQSPTPWLLQTDDLE